MRVEQDRNEYDRVAEENRDQCLPPVHPRSNKARGQHIGWDAVRHADPERGIVVGRPVAPRDRNWGEILVVKWTRLDPRMRAQLDTLVRSFPLNAHHVLPLYREYSMAITARRAPGWGHVSRIFLRLSFRQTCHPR